jgi:hypothetical protein
MSPKTNKKTNEHKFFSIRQKYPYNFFLKKNKQKENNRNY